MSKDMSLRQRIEAAMDNKIPDLSHDVIFIVGEERVKISCNKFPLIVASPVFEAMFSKRHNCPTTSNGSEIVHSNSSVDFAECGQLIEESNGLEICIPDIEAVGFKNLIKYAYTHILNVNVKDALATMYAAHKYDLQDLAEYCSEVLQSKMSIENVVTCYQAALLLNDKELEEKSWEFIQLNAGKLLVSEQFIEFTEDNLCKFLKLDEMPNVTSEVNVFIEMLRWGKYQCKKDGKYASNENLKSVLKNAVPLIRYPTMNHDEFIDIVEPSGMLSEMERINLYKYFLQSGERQLSISKTMNYSLVRRIGPRFVFCSNPEIKNFNVVYTPMFDSFIVTGTGNTGLKLKAVGIVLSPRMSILYPYPVLLFVPINISLFDASTNAWIAGGVVHTTKKVYSQICYVEFDNCAVSIKPNVLYKIVVNCTNQGRSPAKRFPFVQYNQHVLNNPTRTLHTSDNQERTLTFHPNGYVIWALQFE